MDTKLWLTHLVPQASTVPTRARDCLLVPQREKRKCIGERQKRSERRILTKRLCCPSHHSVESVHYCRLLRLCKGSFCLLAANSMTFDEDGREGKTAGSLTSSFCIFTAVLRHFTLFVCCNCETNTSEFPEASNVLILRLQQIQIGRLDLSRRPVKTECCSSQQSAFRQRSTVQETSTV